MFEEALSKILSIDSVFATLFVFSCGICYILYKRNIRLQEQRVTDLKDLLEKWNMFTSEQKLVLNNIYEFLKLQSGSSRSIQESKE